MVVNTLLKIIHMCQYIISFLKTTMYKHAKNYNMCIHEIDTSSTHHLQIEQMTILYHSC